MIESGSIVQLSNNKKYLITDSTIENNNIYYMTLEVDNESEIPTENSVFFEHKDNTLIPINNENDIDFLKKVFINKFFKEYINV